MQRPYKYPGRAPCGTLNSGTLTARTLNARTLNARTLNPTPSWARHPVGLEMLPTVCRTEQHEHGGVVWCWVCVSGNGHPPFESSSC